jgi:mRNA interferase RelE/StbE
MAPPYSFSYTEKALQSLADLPPKLRRQVAKKIARLADEPKPPGCKQLHDIQDGNDPVYRIRQGDYRVLYVVREPILILDIGHPKDVYD